MYYFASTFIIETFAPNHIPDACKISKFLELFISAGVLVAIILTICFWIIIAVFPRGPLTIGILIPEAFFSFPIKIAMITFHCYFITILVTNFTVHAICVFLYLLYFTLLFTKELNLHRHTYITKNSLRDATNLRTIFRSFQVLHETGLSFLGKFVLVMNGEFMICIIYTTFVLIKYGGLLQTSVYVGLLLTTFSALLSWTILLEFGSEFYRRGNVVLASWRKKQEWSKDMVKFVASCRPILICYGKYFVLGSACLPNFYRCVVRGTQRALLTTKTT